MRTNPFYGNRTVSTGTPVQLSTSSERMERGLLIKSMSANTGVLYIGFDSSVTTGNGYPLSAGQDTVIPVLDPSFIFVVASATGTDIRFIGV